MELLTSAGMQVVEGIPAKAHVENCFFLFKCLAIIYRKITQQTKQFNN